MKILIIEDDKWFAESVSSNLVGHSLKIADSPETAITIIDKWKPDLLLLDIILGTTNGLALLYELQSYTDTRQLPIIIISAEGKRLKLDNLRKLGVIDVIDKTKMTPESLYSKIKEIAFNGGVDYARQITN